MRQRGRLSVRGRDMLKEKLLSWLSGKSIRRDEVGYLRRLYEEEREERLRLQEIIFRNAHLVESQPQPTVEGSTPRPVVGLHSWARAKKRLEMAGVELARKAADDRQRYWSEKVKKSEEVGELAPEKVDNESGIAGDGNNTP